MRKTEKMKNNLIQLNNKEKSIFQRFTSNLDFSMDHIDFKLVFLIIILVLFGNIMVFSATSYKLVDNGENVVGAILKQFIYSVLGLVLMFLTSSFDYHKYTKKFYKVSFFVVLVLCIATQLFTPIAGAHRWIRLGPLSFQPSEIAKYFVVMSISYIFTMEGMDKKKKLGLIAALILIFTIEIQVFQRNLSTAGIIFMSGLIMLFISNFKRIYSLLGLAGGVVIALVGIMAKRYRSNRIQTYLDPFSDASGEGHQIVQSLYALSFGGVFGRGIGNSRLKAYWLPEAQNDFIFAIVCEEFGLFGALLLMGAFWYLIHRGFLTARRAEDDYGKYIASGITSVLLLQVFINIAVVIGAMPVTGVTLPFISSGGTSLVVNLAALGILLNISKQSRKRYIKDRVETAKTLSEDDILYKYKDRIKERSK